MKLNYNLTGDARKSLAGAISRILNAPTEYAGVPTFAYKVGEYTIDKAGTLTGPDNLDLEDDLRLSGFDADGEAREYDKPETYENGLGGMGAIPSLEEFSAKTAKPKRGGIMDALVEALNENADEGEHWERLHSTPQMERGDGRWRNLDGTFANTAPVYETIAIELPFPDNGCDSNVLTETLRNLINSKASLIKKALGENGTGDLPIEFTETTVNFEWLRFGVESEVVQAWSAFLAAAVKFAKSAKRVTAKDTAVENEKFAFRTFLVKIGMNDITNKVYRKQLLKNLSGDAAFATPESKARWQANQKAKKAEVIDNE